MSLARLGAFRRGRPDFLISRYGLPFLVTRTVCPGLRLSGSNCRAYWRAVTFFISDNLSLLFVGVKPPRTTRSGRVHGMVERRSHRCPNKVVANRGSEVQVPALLIKSLK